MTDLISGPDTGAARAIPSDAPTAVLPPVDGDQPVAVAHVDCDRYESVRTCLDRIAPRLSPGGVMIVDDYEFKSGCKHAVDEFMQENRARFSMIRKTRVHIVRK